MQHVQRATELRSATDIDGVIAHAAREALHFDVGDATAVQDQVAGDSEQTRRRTRSQRAVVDEGVIEWPAGIDRDRAAAGENTVVGEVEVIGRECETRTEIHRPGIVGHAGDHEAPTIARLHCAGVGERAGIEAEGLAGGVGDDAALIVQATAAKTDLATLRAMHRHVRTDSQRVTTIAHEHATETRNTAEQHFGRATRFRRQRLTAIEAQIGGLILTVEDELATVLQYHTRARHQRVTHEQSRAAGDREVGIEQHIVESARGARAQRRGHATAISDRAALDGAAHQCQSPARRGQRQRVAAVVHHAGQVQRTAHARKAVGEIHGRRREAATEIQRAAQRLDLATDVCPVGAGNRQCAGAIDLQQTTSVARQTRDVDQPAGRGLDRAGVVECARINGEGLAGGVGKDAALVIQATSAEADFATLRAMHRHVRTEGQRVATVAGKHATETRYAGEQDFRRATRFRRQGLTAVETQISRLILTVDDELATILQHHARAGT